MAVQYSIQKMVSNGTLSTVALGIQYLQRNDIYMRIAGEETPQVGAPSGYTWSFINNTALKILPVVPNGVEVVVYRRTDVDAVYNVYSQNAQFDERTIDENNKQLLYIAQEYLEQGLPGAGVDSIEFLTDDGTNTYYRVKLTDGSYSNAFSVPSAGSITKALARESIRRSYADAGFNLVDGSFQVGFTLVDGKDVALDEVSGKAFSGPAGTYPAGTNPMSGGFVDESSWLPTSLTPLPADSFTDADIVGRKYSNVLILGDSITEGVGATSYTDSYAYKLGRSFFNAQTHKYTDDNGLMYETNLNVFKAWSEVGLGSTGGGSSGISFVNRGLVDKQLKIPSGEFFEIKLREFAKVGFFYDGTVTTATSATVSLNGTSIGTLTLGQNEAGSHSGFVNMPFGKETELSDTVRITSVDGDLYISGITTHALSTVGGGLYFAPRGGWSFDDFNTPAKIAEINKVLFFNKSISTKKLVVIALGTNSIYQTGGRNQTPAEYIASLDALIRAITAVHANTAFLLTVPPRSNSSLYPVVNTNYVYEDYVRAIVDYAVSTKRGLVRYDKSAVGTNGIFLSDGLHPNNAGHGIMAAELCKVLGIPYDPYVKTIDFKDARLKRFEIPIADFPGSGGAPTIKWVDLQKPVSRIRGVRLRTSSGIEVQAEAVRDLSLVSGIFWHNQGTTATRFFYRVSGGFARSTGYYHETGLLNGASTGVTLVVDYQ